MRLFELIEKSTEPFTMLTVITSSYISHQQLIASKSWINAEH